jgi:hypothetical protein
VHRHHYRAWPCGLYDQLLRDLALARLRQAPRATPVTHRLLPTDLRHVLVFDLDVLAREDGIQGSRHADERSQGYDLAVPNIGAGEILLLLLLAALVLGALFLVGVGIVWASRKMQR